LTYPTPPVPNYTDQVGPVVSSAELNWLDQQARLPGVMLANPVVIATGGTGANNAAQALANLGGVNAGQVGAQITSTVTPSYVGGLLYPITGPESAAGLTPTMETYPGPGQAPEVHLFRYLTVFQINDVVTYGFSQPLAGTIQSVINMLNNWSVYSAGLGNKGSPGPDYNSGGILFCPGGGYLLETTVLGAPNIILRGAVPLRSSIVQVSGYNASAGALITVCKAKAGTFPANQYMFDSGTWRRANEDGTTTTTPYRSVLATDQFLTAADGGVDSNAFIVGFQLENMALDGNNVAFGGRRQQLGAFFRDDGIAVYNTLYTGLAYTQCFEFELGASTIAAPIPLYCAANESMMGDQGEWQHYSESSSAWVSGNQSLINSVFYADSGAEPGNWGGLTLKCAIFQWCANVTIGYYAGNAGNVGIEAYRSNINILHWENEFTADGAHPGALILARSGSTVVIDGLSTKATCALASGDSNSKVIIRQPFFFGCPSTFTPLTNESSSTFLVELWNLAIPDQVLGSQMRVSNVNLSRVFNPQVNGVNYTGALTLYCDSSTGSATLDGFLAAYPTTIDGALLFIANNPQIEQWAVLLAGGETHTIANAHSLINQNVGLGVISGGAPTLAIHSSISLQNCYFGAGTINVTCNKTQMFVLTGSNNVDIPSSSVTIPASSVMFAPAASISARVLLTGYGATINFGSSSGLCSGGATPSYINYEDVLGGASTTGAPALEGISSGKVKKVVSWIV